MVRNGKSIQLKFVKYRNYVTLCTECMMNTIIYPAKIFWCYGNKYDINTCLCFDNYSFCPLPSMIGFKKSLKNSCWTYSLSTIWYTGLWKYHARLVRPGPISFRTSRKFLFTCPWTSTMYKVNAILYFIFWLIITSSHFALKTVWILISWLLQKPADLDLHWFQGKPADQDPYCLQELIYISGFILFLKELIV